jgi:iron complex transport system permease protein
MPRITIDTEQLLAEGRISPEEVDRLISLAEPHRGSARLIQVLYILGALGLAAGVILLDPSPVVGIVLALGALALAAVLRDRENFTVLSAGLSIAGTIGFCAAFAMQASDYLPTIAIHAAMTGLTLASAIFYRSLFLAALPPFGLSAMLGSGTEYWHASYGVFIAEPTINAALFAVLFLILLIASEKLAGIYAKQATIASRVSWIIMHMALWVGSLWGDNIGSWFMAGRNPDIWDATPLDDSAFFIPDWAFVIAWAALSLASIFYLKTNRFAVNAAVTFLAINAYTQYFERFEANPISLIVAGISMFAVAYGLFRFDQWSEKQRKV